MKTFLFWWTLLSRNHYFGRAKFLAVLCALNLAAMVYFSLAGDFGWVLPLVIIFFVLSSTCFEQLGWALRTTPTDVFTPQVAGENSYYELEPQTITARQLGRTTATAIIEETVQREAKEEEADDEFADYTEESDEEAEIIRSGKSATAILTATATVLHQPQQQPQYSQQQQLTGEQKLALCQFYAFVYAIIKHQLVGEAIWLERGMLRKQYRQWIHGLAAPSIAVVAVKNGQKPQVLEESLEAALGRIALRLGQPNYWQFPLWYFHQQRGAEQHWETLYTFKHNGKEPPLLPIYPKRLKLEFVGSNSEVERA